MQLSETISYSQHHSQGDSDEEGDDKGEAHTQIEGVLTKAAWLVAPNHAMACDRITGLHTYIHAYMHACIHASIHPSIHPYSDT